MKNFNNKILLITSKALHMCKALLVIYYFQSTLIFLTY